jgi:hypothetical protein
MRPANGTNCDLQPVNAIRCALGAEQWMGPHDPDCLGKQLFHDPDRFNFYAADVQNECSRVEEQGEFGNHLAHPTDRYYQNHYRAFGYGFEGYEHYAHRISAGDIWCDIEGSNFKVWTKVLGNQLSECTKADDSDRTVLELRGKI